MKEHRTGAEKIIAVGNIVVDAIYSLPEREFGRRGFHRHGFDHLSHGDLDSRLVGIEPDAARFGGSSFNKGVFAAAVGVPVRIVGVSGRDWDFLPHWRNMRGIEDVTVVGRDRFALGAHVVASDGGWAVATAPGPFADFASIDPDSLFDNGAAVLTVESYLLNNLPWTKALLGSARRNGALVHVDLGAPPLVRRYRDDLLSLIQRFVVFCSGTEEEFAVLLGGESPAAVDAAAIADRFDLHRVVVKRGLAGAVVAERRGNGEVELASVAGSGIPAEPPYSVGCGDVLDGVFMGARMRGIALQPALDAAVAAAIDSCRFPGAEISALERSGLAALGG